MSKEMKNLVKESVRKSLGDRVGIHEAIGLFRKKSSLKPLVKPASNDFPASTSDWDKRARFHQKQAQIHASASHEYGEDGNHEAEDLHDKAARAHRLAHDALHFDNDKEGYKKIAKRADEATREASFFVKEDTNQLDEVSHTDDAGDKRYYYGDDIGRAFKHIVDNYKDKQTGTVNYRSAPDSSKFTAPAHGMIQHLQNVQVAREHPFRPHQFDHFIKIGSNVDRDTRDSIKSDLHDYLADSGHTAVDYKGDPTSDLGNIRSDYIRTVDSNGNPYTISTVNGTAWGGIGIRQGHDK